MSSNRFKPRNTAWLRQMEQRLQKIQSDARRVETEIRWTEAEFRRAEGEFRRLDTELRRDVEALERDARLSSSDPDGTLAPYVEPLRERFPWAPEANLENAARIQIEFRDFSLNVNRLAMRLEPDSREPALREMAEIDRHLPGGLTPVERADISFLAAHDAWRAAGETADEAPVQVAEAPVTTTPEPDAPPPTVDRTGGEGAAKTTTDQPESARQPAMDSPPAKGETTNSSKQLTSDRMRFDLRRSRSHLLHELRQAIGEIGAQNGKALRRYENQTTGIDSLDGVKEFSDNIFKGPSAQRKIYEDDTVVGAILWRRGYEFSREIHRFDRISRHLGFGGLSDEDVSQLVQFESRIFNETYRGRDGTDAIVNAINENYGPTPDGDQSTTDNDSQPSGVSSGDADIE